MDTGNIIELLLQLSAGGALPILLWRMHVADLERKELIKVIIDLGNEIIDIALQMSQNSHTTK